MVVKDIKGSQHVSKSLAGAIRYVNTTGRTFNAESISGYIAFINSPATESINAKLTKGSIQFSVPQTTKATLNLKSGTNISASVLNPSNFSGTNTRMLVDGKLNGGGYKINAEQGVGSIQLNWYNANN